MYQIFLQYQYLLHATLTIYIDIAFVHHHYLWIFRLVMGTLWWECFCVLGWALMWIFIVNLRDWFSWSLVQVVWGRVSQRLVPV